MEQRPKKLLEQVQDVIRLKHYSYQTEKSKYLPTVLTKDEVSIYTHVLNRDGKAVRSPLDLELLAYILHEF